MKMKPLALGIAIAAASAAAAVYAFDLPLPKPIQSPVPSSGTMMPIQEIRPVNVDTSRSIIDQAQKAAEAVVNNKAITRINDFSYDGSIPNKHDYFNRSGITPPDSHGWGKDNHWIESNDHFVGITDLCEFRPNLRTCQRLKDLEDQVKILKSQVSSLQSQLSSLQSYVSSLQCSCK